MMVIPKGDYFFKLQRARRHLDDLETISTEWLSGNHHRVRRYRNPDSPKNFRMSVIVEEVPVEPFVCCIGDTIHNLRGALDHLAFAITKKSPMFDDRMAKHSQFPIFSDEQSEGASVIESKDAFTKMIYGMPPLAQAEIKKLQPYQWGSIYKQHPLWVLNELSNFDKHRLLLIARCCGQGTIVVSDNPLMRDVRILQNIGIPIHGETEILNIEADDEHIVNMNLQPRLEIIFDYGRDAIDGKGVLWMLSAINNFIIKSVIPPLSKFL